MRAPLGVLVASLGMTWAAGAHAQIMPLVQPGTMPENPKEPPLPDEWRSGPEPSNAALQRLNGDTPAGFRGIEVAYAGAEVGGGYASLGKNLGDGKAGEGALAFGARLGLRFDGWTVGLRFQVMPLSESTLMLGTIEGGYHLPMGAWDPYVSVHAGYALDSGQPMVGDVSLPSPRGEALGLSVGDDYYFSALFSVGLDMTFDALFLSRQGYQELVGVGGGTVIATSPSASAVGAVLMGSAHAGLHFDL